MGETVYDDNGLVIVFLDPVLNEGWSDSYYQFNFCFMNNSETNLNVECETFIVNGSEINRKPIRAAGSVEKLTFWGMLCRILKKISLFG